MSLTAPVVQGMSIVKVDVISKGSGPPVTRDDRYSSMVTLYIEDDNGEKKNLVGRGKCGRILDVRWLVEPTSRSVCLSLHYGICLDVRRSGFNGCGLQVSQKHHCVGIARHLAGRIII